MAEGILLENSSYDEYCKTLKKRGAPEDWAPSSKGGENGPDGYAL
jgi:hypothetical protein